MNKLFVDILHDTLPMLPFLFITYVLMEYIEHKSNGHLLGMLKYTKRLGPIFGALFGVVPQCGFSVIASGLYMNQTITLGTLIAVFISTSDEAIPILISQPKQLSTLFSVIAVKLCIAIIVGYIVDLLMRKQHIKQKHPIHDIHADCNEETKQHSIAYIALIHTIKIFIFVFLVNFILSYIIEAIGETTLRQILADGSLLQPLYAAIVGFIPNCAASVILSQLYLEGVLSFGSLTAGLITSAGLGLLVLIRMYDNKKDIARILAILFASAAISGILLQILM